MNNAVQQGQRNPLLVNRLNTRRNRRLQSETGVNSHCTPKKRLWTTRRTKYKIWAGKPVTPTSKFNLHCKPFPDFTKDWEPERRLEYWTNKLVDEEKRQKNHPDPQKRLIQVRASLDGPDKKPDGRPAQSPSYADVYREIYICLVGLSDRTDPEAKKIRRWYQANIRPVGDL